MAWVCVRCERKIYEPRPSAIRFGMLWRYKKRAKELTVELRNLEKIKNGATITHLHCEGPEREGFTDRMKSKLGMPVDSDHPLLV